MLFICLRASLVALVAYAATVSAAPSLTVKASTSDNVNGVRNLKVTTIVTNTCGETLKLLKDPRGVLNPFPGDSFVITNHAGSGPSFNGAMAKYDPAYAASLNDPSIFTVLPPGGSISVTHDLSAAYDFTKSGTGDYSIEPSNLFTYVDTYGTPKDFHAAVGRSAKVRLFGELAVPRAHRHRYTKRATFQSCSENRQRILVTAARNAKDYSTKAFEYLKDRKTPTPRYVAWFGAYNTGRKMIVLNRFRKIKNNRFSKFTYDCSCVDPSIWAYVRGEEFGIVHLCGAFWKHPATGTNSQAGTLVHEASHFIANGFAIDVKYGHEECQTLAKRKPVVAIANADNYEFFAENTPALA